LFLSIILTSTAQILQKLAADKSKQLGESGQKQFLSPFVLLSLACLGLALLLWLVVLSVMPVSQAYPMLSLSYIIVMLLARWIFKEHIPWQRWFGAALIMLGISCLTGSA
jgi:undecaprenyl phosphate-alpha-L-ara4N flippase subunit ArnE